MLKPFIKDDITAINATFLSTFFDFFSPDKQALVKKDPFLNAENKILVKAGTIITLDNGEKKSFSVTNDIELSQVDLESGSFLVGKDYYIYLVDDNANGDFVISLNSTYPAGYNAQNSRKIGGFHYGHIRKVSNDGLWNPIDSEGTVYGSGAIVWQDNVTTGIVPNSVWDLKHRPQSSPEGMVFVGNIWVDIYQTSGSVALKDSDGSAVTSGIIESAYGCTPLRASRGIGVFNFPRICRIYQKELLNYQEWMATSYGNPPGNINNNYGYVSGGTPARTGCSVDENGNYDDTNGLKPYAISSCNVIDAVGNLREYVDNLLARWDVATGWTKYDFTSGNGNLELYNDDNLVSPGMGGSYFEGTDAGNQHIYIRRSPWHYNTNHGFRLKSRPQ